MSPDESPWNTNNIRSIGQIFGESGKQIDIKRQQRTAAETHSTPLPKHTESKDFNASFEKYTQVYFDVVAKFDLAPASAILLSTVWSLSKNKNKYCYMGKAKLARLINISEPTLFAHIKILVDKDLLIVIPPKFKLDTSKLRLTSHADELLTKIKESLSAKYRRSKNDG